MTGSAATEALFSGAPDEPELQRRIASMRILWERAGSSHVVMGAACSCGLPAMHVSVADFELDLADYLRSKWSQEKQAVELIDAASGKIGKLIDGLAQDVLPADLARSMLDDLETAVRSFAPSVGPGAAQRVG